MDDLDRLAELPLTQADQLARERIEYHREQMAVWRRARARRLADEQQRTGKSARALAADLGVHFTVVTELLREARGDR